MRAAICDGDGGPLRLAETPAPTPGPGDVLVRVAACGVNFADGLMRAGRYQEKPTPPFSPGIEVAGEVIATGAEVTRPRVGEAVVAVTGSGGFAEIACAPAIACAPLPPGLAPTTAAALPVAHGSAHMALDHKADLRAGERLLVLGAAGGTGLAAVEIGALMGAEVVAVARGADRLALARAKGAAETVESDAPDLVARLKGIGGVDVVFDPVGGDAWKAALRAARFNARLLPIGFASGEVPQIPANILLVKNLTVIGFYWGAYIAKNPAPLRQSLVQLLDWAAAGQLAPHVEAVLPLSEANDALDRLAARQVSGKLVIAPGA